MFNYFLTVKIMDDMHNLRIGDTLLEAAHELSNHSDQRLFQCDKTLTGYKNFMNHKKCHMTWTCENSGFTPPSKLQLRNNSPYSSPYSSPFRE